jgi:hypothetical protein
MVRNPYLLVYSAYEFHRNTGEAEDWSIQSVATLPQVKGAQSELVDSFATYTSWCAPKTPLNASLSYRETLNALPLRDGLVMEIINTMSVVANMLKSAKDCATASANAHTSDPPGSCLNFFMEDLMVDYITSYRTYLVQALDLHSLQLPEHFAQDFARSCNPSMSKNANQASHSTVKGAKRAATVELIKQLDAEVFNNALRDAETQLNALEFATKRTSGYHAWRPPFRTGESTTGQQSKTGKHSKRGQTHRNRKINSSRNAY